MRKILSASRIRVATYALMFFVFVSGIFQVVQKTYIYVSSPESINIVKVDVPWFHPADNVSILLDQERLVRSDRLFQEVQENVFLFDLLQRIVDISLLLLLLYYLQKLLVSISNRTFLEPPNLAVVRRLSVVVAGYVVVGILFYQLIPLAVPHNLVVESMNFVTLGESVFENLAAATDFKMLLVAICLYVIAVSFREGYLLKQDSDLTI